MENTISDTEKAAYDEAARVSGNLKRVEVLLSSAEILALYTTSKEIVPAVAGQVIEFVSAVLLLEYASAAYATNGDITFQTGTTGTALSDTVALADFLAATADAARVVQALSADTQLDPGESLVLACATGNPATGDSPVRAIVYYREHVTNF